jgi:hypothetical protein
MATKKKILNTQSPTFDATAARLKAMKAVKDLGKVPSLPPPVNKGKTIDAKKVVIGGKTTTFKRTRTSTKGKKITEIVTRKSKGRSREYVEGVKSVRNQGNFPLSFAEYYKWLNEDLGWELIEEKLDVAGATNHAYDSVKKWAGTPQTAIAAYKAAKSFINKDIKKQKIREGVIDTETETARKRIETKIKKAEAVVKSVEMTHDNIKVKADKGPQVRKAWYKDFEDESKERISKRNEVKEALARIKDERTGARRELKTLGSALSLFKK